MAGNRSYAYAARRKQREGERAGTRWALELIQEQIRLRDQNDTEPEPSPKESKQ